MMPFTRGRFRVFACAVIVCALLIPSVVGTQRIAQIPGFTSRVAVRDPLTVDQTSSTHQSDVKDSPHSSGTAATHAYSTIQFNDEWVQTSVYDSAKNEVFVPAWSHVYVISVSSNQVLDTIPVWSLAPESAVYDSASGEVFISNWYGTLLVINDTTDSIVANLTSIEIDPHAGSCATSNNGWDDNGYLEGLALDNETGDLILTGGCGAWVVSTANDSMVATLSGTTWAGGFCPTYDSRTNQVFLTAGLRELNVYSLSSVSYGATISPAQGIALPYDAGWQLGPINCITYDSAASEVFVSDNGTTTAGVNRSYVTVISDRNASDALDPIVANIPMTPAGFSVEGLSYDPLAGAVFASSRSGDKVVAISDANDWIVANFSTPNPSSTTFVAPTDELYVTNGGGVDIISLRPTASLTASQTSVDANETVTLTTALQDVNGGPYTYQYQPSNSYAGCVRVDGPFLNCTPTRSGSFTALVNVTDAKAMFMTATSPLITVLSSLQTTFVASNSTPLLGQTIALIVNASGGAAPYSFVYTGMPPGCVSVNKSAVGCLPTQSGFYNITVTVTDVNHGVATAQISLQVIFDFNVVVPAKSSVGSPLTIRVNIDQAPTSNSSAIVPGTSFGTLTYNYSGLPPGCANADVATLTCTPTRVGEYNISVSVHDEVGDHNTHVVSVNIVPATSTSTGILGFSGNVGYLVIGAVIAVTAIAIGVLLIHSRRSKRANRTTLPSTPTPEPPIER